MHSLISKTVQKEVKKFLDKSFFFSSGDNNYTEELILAATANTYVETAEGKADNLHLKIKQCNWENFLDVYQEMIKSYTRKLNLRSGILAFDVTTEPFYGKTCGFYTIGCENQNGYQHEFHFLVISLINDKKQEKIPLACVPVHYGFDFGKAVKTLLAYASKLFKIRFILFDRWFYSIDVINALNGFRYIMLIPKKDQKIKDLCEVVGEAGYFYHKLFSSATLEEAITRIVLVRDKIKIKNEEKEIVWSFATNMIFDDYYTYVEFYKKRWRIETNFRVEDEAKIKSKSIFPVIRYFYFTVGLLLHSIWLVFRKEIPFKKFLIHFYKYIMLESLGIDQVSPC